MAYVSKEKKQKIAAALKNVVPSDWKYTLRVFHHSKIIMTIRKAPIDLVELNGGHRSVNPYRVGDSFDGEVKETFKKIVDALNTDNYDNSDSQSDYFDVGHYVGIQLGEYDKPLVLTG